MKELDVTEVEKNTDDKNYETMLSFLTGVCGFVPFVGNAIVESVKVLIPNDREERVIDFLQRVAEMTNEHNAKLEKIEEKLHYFEDLTKDGLKRRLFEVGIQCAANISDANLKETFSRSFFKIVIDNTPDEIETEMTIKLISELSLPEAIILISYIEKLSFGQSDFDNRWKIFLSSSYKYRERILSLLSSKGLMDLDSGGEWTESGETYNHRLTRFGEEIAEIIYDEKIFGKISKFVIKK